MAENSLSLRGNQLETLRRYADQIQHRFDVEFYLQHGPSLVSLCGSAFKTHSENSSTVPTQCSVYIISKTQSQQNISLAKAFVSSLMKDGEPEQGEEAGEEDVSGMSMSQHLQLTGKHSSASTNTEDEEFYNHSFSPGLESNHDSCYDSDGSQSGSRRSSCARSDLHVNVSRTSSDTLAAEHSDPEDKQAALDADYTSKAEFAIKLGFNEDLLRKALCKLGPAAKQNELLEELISLSAKHEGRTSPLQMDDITSYEDLTPPNPHAAVVPSTKDENDASNLRPIVIDGSNVAMSHGNKEVFSCRGIRLAVDWFLQRGHKNITVFVPQWRKESPRPDAPITDQEIMSELEKEGILSFTPSRRVQGKRVTCYDDRYVLRLASDTDGIVVSNDNYRDLLNDFKTVIEERLLMYTFAQDRFMPPEDPAGRYGPTLDNFLRKKPTGSEVLPPECPYGKKCTFGNKCKFYHPERKNQPHRMVVDKLAEQAKKLTRDLSSGDRSASVDGSPVKKPLGKALSLQTPKTASQPPVKKALSRTRSLAPGFVPAASCEEKAKQEKVKLIPHKQHLAINESVKPHLTLTAPTPTEPERCRSHDDILSAYHLHADTRDMGRLNVEDQSAVHLPQHWKVHEALRETQSDPHRLYYTGGHLALAKKLSDEGNGKGSHGVVRKELSLSSRESSQEGEPDGWSQVSRQQISPPLIQPTQQPQVEKTHAKLARQLSLKGNEDPRWQEKQAQSQTAAPATPHQLRLSSNPHTPIHRSASENTFTSPNAKWMFHPAEQVRPNRSLHRQAALNHFGSYPHVILPDMSQPPPGVKAPLIRLGSAPGPPSYKPPEHAPIGRVPQMTRQSSSSDSQLHLYQDDLADNAPSLTIPSSTQWPGTFVQAFQVHQQNDLYHQPLQDGGREQRVLSPGPVFYPQSLSHIPDPRQATCSPPAARTLSPARSFSPSLMGGPPSMGVQTPMGGPPPPPMGPVISHPPSAMGGHVLGPPPPPPPDDPHQTLYYHLCGLFDREKVLCAMNENPTITDAKVLCALIIKMSD